MMNVKLFWIKIVVKEQKLITLVSICYNMLYNNAFLVRLDRQVVM